MFPIALHAVSGNNNTPRSSIPVPSALSPSHKNIHTQRHQLPQRERPTERNLPPKTKFTRIHTQKVRPWSFWYAEQTPASEIEITKPPCRPPWRTTEQTAQNSSETSYAAPHSSRTRVPRVTLCPPPPPPSSTTLRGSRRRNRRRQKQAGAPIRPKAAGLVLAAAVTAAAQA